MNYREALDFLYARQGFFSRKNNNYVFHLQTVVRFLEALGNPQQSFAAIHVGGTNGKGSVTHLIGGALIQNGYTTGVFCSPHVFEFGERIKVGGTMISPEFVVAFIQKHQNIIAALQPSFFEIIFVMACAYFALKKVQIAVIEVGLGGRLDATNVLQPMVSVITNISLEHTRWLGHHLAAIAYEKAGIIKTRTPVVIGERRPATEAVFKAKARQQQAPIYFADRFFSDASFNTRKDWLQLSLSPRQSYCFDLNADYQKQNILTALCALHIVSPHYPTTYRHNRAAFRQIKTLTQFRGRLEQIARKPATFIDVAHNAAALEALFKSLSLERYMRLHLIYGAMADKDMAAIFKTLPKNALYYISGCPHKRSFSAAALTQLFRAQGFKVIASFNDVNDALHTARRHAAATDLVLITGSFFLISGVSDAFKGQSPLL